MQLMHSPVVYDVHCYLCVQCKQRPPHAQHVSPPPAVACCSNAAELLTPGCMQHCLQGLLFRMLLT
jgi:hypothetical protein